MPRAHPCLIALTLQVHLCEPIFLLISTAQMSIPQGGFPDLGENFPTVHNIPKLSLKELVENSETPGEEKPLTLTQDAQCLQQRCCSVDACPTRE